MQSAPTVLKTVPGPVSVHHLSIASWRDGTWNSRRWRLFVRSATLTASRAESGSPLLRARERRPRGVEFRSQTVDAAHVVQLQRALLRVRRDRSGDEREAQQQRNQ